MNSFDYKNHALYAEDVSVSAIVESFGTPAYIYSKQAITSAFNAYFNAARENDLICYAVKANANIAVLNLLAKLGAGFDIVSVGELERVIAAGGDPAKVVFSGVAKKSSEIARALEVGIHCFNVESEAELERIQHVAEKHDVKAPISLRVNPDVDAKTHPYISTGLKENKFGIHIDQVLDVYAKAQAMPNLVIKGIDCHIGSQIIDPTPFIDALKRLLPVIEQLKDMGIALSHIDLGGGIGVQYDDETPPDVGAYIQKVTSVIEPLGLGLILEPGRSIVANAGILVTEVEYLKDNGEKHFAIVDAAMNDLLRPALYQSWMRIEEVEKKAGSAKDYDIVGPVCETGDFLGKHRSLVIESGDLLSVFSAGAYGFGMASNYNSRPKACEILVDGDQMHEIRRRESFSDLIAHEILLTE
ncbi:MAG: diaminopimelate decarboxylase [Cellvibrionales bacterium]|nr:diaminopimelate decarboxylase [Cellvibrionales bacterium]